MWANRQDIDKSKNEIIINIYIPESANRVLTTYELEPGDVLNAQRPIT